MHRDIASASLRASEAAALGAYVTVIANRTTNLVPIRHFALTHEGVRRDHNEDSYLADAELAIFAVADGMGGHRAGAVASRIAIETIRAFYQRTRDADTMSWPFGFDPGHAVSGIAADRGRPASQLTPEAHLDRSRGGC